ncbi:CGNR zinc finger domain-containing protein [Nonomuraea sp. NPDC050691]|uniref:CGNR zinc finger domain-containing protein n=1 Tax=Nonomuraea sp. NPDC050691 TaxID=3155661 RepID=UPI0033E5C717
MKVHSTKAMAARAVDLCVVLLYGEPPGGPSVEAVAEVLRAHGETVVPVPGAGPDSGSDGGPGSAPAGPRDGEASPEAGGGGGAMSPYLGEEDVAAMREAAVRLVEVLAAPGPDEAAPLLNRLLDDTARAPRLTRHGGTSPWHLHVDSRDDAPWAEWFLASSALALAVLLADHQRVPGGLCASPGCRRPYLDLGGGSPRRYCSTRCATRERVAAHRSRA